MSIQRETRYSLAQRRCKPFTLLELLLVIGLMLIIMSLSVPAFRRMASGSALNSSLRMLTGQLSLARAAAISEQRYIALVMPGANFDAPAPQVSGEESRSDYHFRSFRVAIVEKTATTDTDGRFEFIQWYPDTTWSFLPVGAVIAEVNDSCINATAGAQYELKGDDENREVNVTADGKKSTDWLGTGNVLNDGNGVVHGVVDGSVKLVDGKTHTGTNWARALVFTPKGRCFTTNDTDTFITVIEGNVEEDSSKYTLDRGDFFSLQILRVSRFTGRTSYEDTYRPVDE